MAASREKWVPERGETIWINFDPQAGREMKSEHPMLVLSTRAFNEKTGLVMGLPMTHSDMNATNPFALDFLGPKNEKCYVLTHMVSTMDWRARDARPFAAGKVSVKVFADACEGLQSILQL